MKLLKLVSSNGHLLFRDTDGVVEKIVEEDIPECKGTLANIYAVDLDILRKVDPRVDEFGESDILFAGYWYVTERGPAHYEPPAWDYIEELRQNRDRNGQEVAS
jgi:hypothetical protein